MGGSRESDRVRERENLRKKIFSFLRGRIMCFILNTAKNLKSEKKEEEILS